MPNPNPNPNPNPTPTPTPSPNPNRHPHPHPYPNPNHNPNPNPDQEMLGFHADCGWDAAQIAATPTRREVFAAPPQMAAAIAEQGQGPSAAAAGAVLPVAQASISAPEDNPLQSPMQCD